MAGLNRLCLVGSQGPAELASDRAREQAAAHADAAMDLPALDRHFHLSERSLPGKDVRVDGVNERAVEVEDERAHLRASELHKPVAATEHNDAPRDDLVLGRVFVQPPRSATRGGDDLVSESHRPSAYARQSGGGG